MKTPQQLKQWVRSAGSKRVIIRQWSTPKQEEFMRDSPSRREFDRLHEMLVFCNSPDDIDNVKSHALSHQCVGFLSDMHADAIMQLAEQYKRKLKERRNSNGWWRRLSESDRFLISGVAITTGVYAMFAAIIVTLAIR